MKWFKHFSDLNSSPDGAYLLDKWGLAGYARWLLILENIAKEMDDTNETSLTLLQSVWCKRLKTSWKVLETFLKDVEQKLNISWKLNQNELTLNVPKLAKIRDNHTKHLQVTMKKVSLDIDKEYKIKNKIKKKENKEKVSFEKEFEEIWNQYPNKLGKQKALKSFQETVALADDLQKIRQALAQYHKHLAANPWKKPQHGSTWFNSWQEWVNYSEPGIASQIPREIACQVCRDEGYFISRDPQGTYACPACLKGQSMNEKYSKCPDDLRYRVLEKLQEAA